MKLFRYLLAAWMLCALLPLPGGSAEIPRRSPEFVIDLVDGQKLLLSKYKGKVVLLEVLLTTCPHCQRSTQLITRLYKEYGPKGLQPVGIAIDPMPRLVIDDFKRKYSVEYPIGYSDRDSLLNYLQHPPMMRLLVPQLVFIDREGTIQKHVTGGDHFFDNEEANLRKEIEQLLGAGAPRPAKAKKSS